MKYNSKSGAKAAMEAKEITYTEYLAACDAIDDEVGLPHSTPREPKAAKYNPRSWARNVQGGRELDYDF